MDTVGPLRADHVRNLRAFDVPSCQWQLPSYKGLDRQQCIEKKAVIRWRQPHLRVVCMTRSMSDVIDSDGVLRPVQASDPLDGQPYPPN